MVTRTSHFDVERGLVATPTPAVVEALLHETATYRRRLHRLHRAPRCDLALTVVGDQAYALGSCVCAEYLSEVLLDVGRYLARVRVDCPAAAGRAHWRRKKVDWIRADRLRRGAQARSDRVRAGRYGQALPDGYHRALLEALVDEAGRPGPLEGDEALLRRLAERAAREFGGPLRDHLDRVAAALPTVERVCRSGARVRDDDGLLVTWWDRYVDRPLGRRPRLTNLTFDADQVGQTGWPAWTGVDPAGVAPSVGAAWSRADDDGVGDEIVLTALGRRPANADPARWIVDTVGDLVDRGIVPAAAAAALSRDPHRLAAAVTALDEVLAARQRLINP